MTAGPRARAALALAAIVVPTVIVAALGYVSLQQWQRSAASLFREQARDIATMAADKLEMVLRQAEDEAFTRLQMALGSGDAPDRVVAGTPLIARLDLFDRSGRRLYPSPPRDDGPVLTTVLAGAGEGVWERGGHRHVRIGDRVVLVGVLRGADGAPVLAVVTRDAERVRRDIFETTLGGLEAPTLVAIVDADGRAVWSRESLTGAVPVLTLPLREGFPGWRLVLYQVGGRSPAGSVRRQVMLFSVAFGLLLLMIAIGVFATWRLVRRETEMARLKADFVANVSHDLKTPLSVIRMFAETLDLGRVRDETTRREYYRVLTQESERLTRLIDNVLDFSRIESGRRAYARHPTAIEPLVREMVDAFGYPLARRTVTVEVASDLPEVALDREAVGQALANLLDNAIKYSDDGTAITVTARAAGERLEIAVADQGIGIPREERARIFEKFYRVGQSETQGRRGSGVGLALVRHVAEAHGGDIAVESRPGEGSRFTLRLPLRT